VTAPGLSHRGKRPPFDLDARERRSHSRCRVHGRRSTVVTSAATASPRRRHRTRRPTRVATPVLPT